MQYPANSSKLCAAKPSRRPPICASDSTAIATKKNPASRPEVRYRSSSAARTRQLLSARERLEDRLAFGARLLRPLVGDLLADFREFGREPGRGLHDLDALVRHGLHVALVLRLARLPAALLGGPGGVGQRLLRRRVELGPGVLVDDHHVLRQERLR